MADIRAYKQASANDIKHRLKLTHEQVYTALVGLDALGLAKVKQAKNSAAKYWVPA